VSSVFLFLVLQRRRELNWSLRRHRHHDAAMFSHAHLPEGQLVPARRGRCRACPSRSAPLPGLALRPFPAPAGGRLVPRRCGVCTCKAFHDRRDRVAHSLRRSLPGGPGVGRRPLNPGGGLQRFFARCGLFVIASLLPVNCRLTAACLAKVSLRRFFPRCCPAPKEPLTADRTRQTIIVRSVDESTQTTVPRMGAVVFRGSNGTEGVSWKVDSLRARVRPEKAVPQPP